MRIVPSDRSGDAFAPVTDEEAREEGLRPTGFKFQNLPPRRPQGLFETRKLATGAQLAAYAQREGLPISDAVCGASATCWRPRISP